VELGKAAIRQLFDFGSLQSLTEFRQNSLLDGADGLVGATR
jgi:hypothetical protein